MNSSLGFSIEVLNMFFLRLTVIFVLMVVLLNANDSLALNKLKWEISCVKIVSPIEPGKKYKCEDKHYLFENGKWNFFFQDPDFYSDLDKSKTVIYYTL